jgi:hypothetical protein
MPPPHARIHNPGPQQSPRCLPTGHHQLQRRPRATHVIPAAPPRVPPETLPEPASPATSPRVGTIAPYPRPSPLLSTHRTVNYPRVHDIPKIPLVSTQLDFLDDSLSSQQVLPWQSPWPNPPVVHAPSLPLKQPHRAQLIATT